MSHSDSDSIQVTKTGTVLREYVQAFVIAILAAFVLRTFVVQAFRIPTGSMKDTLMVGDFLLVNKFVYGVRTPDHLWGTSIEIPHVRLPGFRQPRRGDIVIFKYPKDESVDYIKRCVALPGDTVLVRQNTVYVNGKPEGRELYLGEKYDQEEHATYLYYRITTADSTIYTIRKRANRVSPNQNYGPVVVPPDHLFMMGDNRDNSSDSRYWGFMPMENILGKAMIIYFSFDKQQWNPAANVIGAVRWHRIFNRIR